MDNKEAIEHVKDAMCILKTRHILLDLDDEVTPEDRKEYIKQFMSLQIALSALEDIDNIREEREAAIADMEDMAKSVNVNCRYCKNLSEKNKLLHNETMRESKCFDCECFSSWEWRGIRNERMD